MKSHDSSFYTTFFLCVYSVVVLHKQEAHIYLGPLPDYMKKLSDGIPDNRYAKAIAGQAQSLTLAATFITGK